MRDEQRHLARGQFGESGKDFVFRTRVQRSGRLVKDQQLRVTQIGPGQSDFLPFSAGEIESALEPASQDLLVAFGQRIDELVRAALFCRGHEIRQVIEIFYASRGDIFGCASFRSARNPGK